MYPGKKKGRGKFEVEGRRKETGTDKLTNDKEKTKLKESKKGKAEEDEKDTHGLDPPEEGAVLPGTTLLVFDTKQGSDDERGDGDEVVEGGAGADELGVVVVEVLGTRAVVEEDELELEDEKLELKLEAMDKKLEVEELKPPAGRDENCGQQRGGRHEAGRWSPGRGGRRLVDNGQLASELHALLAKIGTILQQ
ncbi:hypothetical protein GALMADRAFT_135550 [Galerina marginata CBS 339.88]|uniref:Uncharacterized protein n=1 Tax=Galerina marginata (strain CBS 339.88) TaxID=685588 RepID=A0A067TIK5_GALM3|nr:hypothetical protein GALMADRAFT_135550 [Galerina marginata CBS 339.88]